MTRTNQRLRHAVGMVRAGDGLLRSAVGEELRLCDWVPGREMDARTQALRQLSARMTELRDDLDRLIASEWS